MKNIFILAFISLFLLLSCGEDYEQKGSTDYINAIQEWDQIRESNLKKTNGWLNLVGLYWLEEGDNTFGSDKSNDIVFPQNAAPKMGVFTLDDSTITIRINDGVDVLVDSQLVKEAVLKSDIEEGTTIMDYGTLSWYTIVRDGGKFGIRMRDLEAPLVKNFKGIERFPINEDWRIKAKWVPLDPPYELVIPNIIGTQSKAKILGRLVFEIDKKAYSLYPTGKENLFIIFADQTSGIETYGAGRFLYTKGPDSNNVVILDFNKAYNPPCAFTKYATCPLPPKENQLKVRITAGEKAYGEGH